MAIIFCIYITSFAGGLTADQGNYVPELYSKRERKIKLSIELCEFHFVQLRDVKSCQ